MADALDARFNPVAVRGEVSGFSRAASGHCYFALKDAQGQIRCAMFRRAASLVDFLPKDGDLVEVQGRLGVYEPRGDLQLVVESMSRAGQGALLEQFLRLKARLEAEGLFDAGRKRDVAAMPRAIGVVTSLGAAALHDVVTCLARRAPHVRVVIAPAAVQGAQAPADLVNSLNSLYALAADAQIDTILLVRGGGSIEDLWAFNSEQLAYTIVCSPVPLISGVGHETDFTIADFCADVRAPTPTAAAELAAQPREAWLAALDHLAQQLDVSVMRRVDTASQRLDAAGSRLGRPLGRLAEQRTRLERMSQRLRYGALTRLERESTRGTNLQGMLRRAVEGRAQHASHAMDRMRLRLAALDPQRVLKRGYSLLTDEQGRTITSTAQVQEGQALHALLAQGELGLTVATRKPFSS